MKKLNTDNLDTTKNEIKKLRKKQMQLVLGVLIALVALFISFTIYWEIDYSKKYGYFVKTTATVVDHVVVNNIEYDVLEYEAEGITYNHTSSYKSKNHIEDRISIYYDENNPSGVIYKLDSKRILLPLISGLFLIATIGFYIFYYFVFVRSEKNKLKN